MKHVARNDDDKLDSFCGKFCAVPSDLTHGPERALCEMADISNGNLIVARKGDLLDLQSLIGEALKHMGDRPIEVHQVSCAP